MSWKSALATARFHNDWPRQDAILLALILQAVRCAVEKGRDLDRYGLFRLLVQAPEDGIRCNASVLARRVSRLQGRHCEPSCEREGCL